MIDIDFGPALILREFQTCAAAAAAVEIIVSRIASPARAAAFEFSGEPISGCHLEVASSAARGAICSGKSKRISCVESNLAH